MLDPDDIEAKSPATVERLQRRLLALERLYEVQARASQKSAKKRFIETPAGASLLTGILTITASQMPAYIQALEGRVKTQAELLKPVVAAIAKDSLIDLDMRLALIDAMQSGETRYRTVAEIKSDAARRKQQRADDPLSPPSRPMAPPSAASR